MSAATTPAKPLERIANDPYRLRQFSVTEYHKMAETGILKPDDRVELLEGWIVNKMTQNPPHASSVGRVNRLLGRILPAAWSLRCQAPIMLSDSAPEPDIAIARGEEGTYDSRRPTPADIGALIEVGDSTLLSDRRYKGKLYAKEKVPAFWLVNLVERKIEAYSRPRGGKYQKKTEYAEAETVPLVLDGGKIADIPVHE